LQDGDIFVLAQKIVSKAEGRLFNVVSITPSAKAIELAGQVIRTHVGRADLIESKECYALDPELLLWNIVWVLFAPMPDRSFQCSRSRKRKEEYVLLLPINPMPQLRQYANSLKKPVSFTGVMIIDSHGRAWRLGTVGVAIGISGVPGLVDLRGRYDLFGYELRITQVGAADELAAAASLMMGQAAEGTPVVHVRGFPYPLRSSSLNELIRPKERFVPLEG
jgi:coenzyme F420-0:L-glutamate ligase/coenzyme F420-1:gamma-L-glutamate ligase